MADFDLSLLIKARDEGAAALIHATDADLKQLSKTMSELKKPTDEAKEAARRLREEHAKVRREMNLKTQAAKNMSFQLGDVTQQLSLGINPAVVFGQQIGQVSQAMSDMGGKAAAFGKFMMGPWGLAITAGIIVLGQLAGKLFETEENTKDAEKAAEKFTQRQLDMKNFISDTTGKLIEQNQTLIRNAVLLRQSNIDTNRQKIREGSTAAFDAAKEAADRLRGDVFVERGQTIKRFDPAISQVIGAAKGDVEKLDEGLFRLAQRRPDLAATVKTISEAAAGAVLLSRENKELAKQVDILTGKTVAQGTGNRALIGYQTDLATATSELERARARLNIVELRGADAAKVGGDALKKYTKDLTDAKNAVNASEAAERAGRDARRQGTKNEREAARDLKTAQKEEEERLKVIAERYGSIAKIGRQLPDGWKANNDQLREHIDLLEEGRAKTKDAELQAGVGAVSKFGEFLGGGRIGSLFEKLGGGKNNIGGIFDSKEFGKSFKEAMEPLKEMMRKLGTSIQEAFGGKGDPGALGRTFGKLAAGASIGAGAAGLLGIGGGGKGGQLGGAIGGVLGQTAGEAIGKGLTGAFSKLAGAAGPLGAIAGGILGSLAGGLLGAPVKKGVATITRGDDGDLTSTVTGNSAKRRQAASAAATSIIDALDNIAQQFGGSVTGTPSVSIGVRNDDFRVDPTGGGKTKKKFGAVDFGSDQAAAIAFATLDAIKDGVISGMSAAVKKALESSDDLEKALKEALAVQGVEDSLNGFGAELTKTFRDFELQAKERVRIAREYGFDVVKIEAQNADDRAKLIEDTLSNRLGQLKDTLNSFKFGDLFEGSAVDRRVALQSEIAKALSDAEAGVAGAADKLASLQQQLVNTSKEAFGTAGPEYATDREQAINSLQRVLDLETKRVQDAQAMVQAQLTAAQAQVTLQSETNDLLAVNNTNQANILAALQAGGASGLLGFYQRQQTIIK